MATEHVNTRTELKRLDIFREAAAPPHERRQTALAFRPICGTIQTGYNPLIADYKPPEESSLRYTRKAWRCRY